MAEKDKFDEFLEEVENDIRQERFEKLWKTYGKHLTTGITAILVVLAAHTLWSNHKTREHAKNSEYFTMAHQLIAEGKSDQALSVLKTISADKTYHPLAQFTQAAILSDTPDNPENINQAISLYETLAGDTSIELLWRHVAILQSVRLKFTQDSDKGADLLSVLDPLTTDGAPLQALALEQKAYMLYKMGKTTQAADLYASIIQLKDAPEGITMRAQIMSEKINSRT